MALWILAAMQYSDDFNFARCHMVKQGMAFYGETSDIQNLLEALLKQPEDIDPLLPWNFKL